MLIGKSCGNKSTDILFEEWAKYLLSETPILYRDSLDETEILNLPPKIGLIEVDDSKSVEINGPGFYNNLNERYEVLPYSIYPFQFFSDNSSKILLNNISGNAFAKCFLN